MPAEVAPLDQLRDLLLALQDHAEIGFVLRLVDGGIEKRLVMHDPSGFEPAGGGDNSLRCGIVDPHGQLMRREAAEDDGMDRAEAGTGQHRLKRLGHHRHVDDDAVALADALGLQRPGKACHAIAQLAIGDALGGMGDRAVMDDGQLLSAPALHMAVDRVPAGVDHPVREPFIKRCILGEERLARRFDPVDGLGRLHPERIRVGLPATVDILIRHGILLRTATQLLRSENAPGKRVTVHIWGGGGGICRIEGRRHGLICKWRFRGKNRGRCRAVFANRPSARWLAKRPEAVSGLTRIKDDRRPPTRFGWSA